MATDFVLTEWPKTASRGRGAAERLRPLFDGQIHQVVPAEWGYSTLAHMRRGLHEAAVTRFRCRVRTMQHGEALVMQRVERDA